MLICSLFYASFGYIMEKCLLICDCFAYPTEGNRFHSVLLFILPLNGKIAFIYMVKICNNQYAIQIFSSCKVHHCVRCGSQLKLTV